MSEQLTTYTVKSKNDSLIWVFKYHLNASLNEFKVLEGIPSPVQFDWLFRKGNFPYYEDQIKSWQTKLKSNFEIIKAEPVLDFEVFWRSYPNNKLSNKKIALERWNKLDDGQKIRLMINLPEYKKLKAKEGTAFPYAEVFIRHKWWDK